LTEKRKMKRKTERMTKRKRNRQRMTTREKASSKTVPKQTRRRNILKKNKSVQLSMKRIAWQREYLPTCQVASILNAKKNNIDRKSPSHSIDSESKERMICTAKRRQAIGDR
jgi:hypothetical protein